MITTVFKRDFRVCNTLLLHVSSSKPLFNMYAPIDSSKVHLWQALFLDLFLAKMQRPLEVSLYIARPLQRHGGQQDHHHNQPISGQQCSGVRWPTLYLLPTCPKSPGSESLQHCNNLSPYSTTHMMNLTLQPAHLSQIRLPPVRLHPPSQSDPLKSLIRAPSRCSRGAASQARGTHVNHTHVNHTRSSTRPLSALAYSFRATRSSQLPHILHNAHEEPSQNVAKRWFSCTLQADAKNASNLILTRKPR